jgi:DNA-binding PadR family transcriptional regulator
VGTADRRWMRGSPLKGALLALMLELERPTYPYKLATLIDRRLGPTARVDREGIYRMLEGLEKLGLVASSTQENDCGSWRRQTVYAPTELAVAAVDVWMATPVTEWTARAELQIKIAFSRPCDAPVLLRVLDKFERLCIGLAAECQEMEAPLSSWMGLRLSGAIKWSEEHLAADVQWITMTRELIRDYIEQDAALRR